MNLGKTNLGILEEIASSITDPNSNSSWTIVVPPGFGESEIPQLLRKLIHEKNAEANVALMLADRIYDRDSWFDQLANQWGIESESTSGRVSELAQKCEKPIQIISRFHKVLDWADETILQDMRDCEQFKQMKSVVICMFRLDWIKKEWREKGTALLASDYGDKHRTRNFMPISLGELMKAEAKRIPVDLLQKLYAWTGGLPEWVDLLVGEYHECIKINPSQNCQELECSLFQKTVDLARRTADHLKPIRLRERTLDFYFHNGAKPDLQELHSHPWGYFIADESGLKVEALGQACLDLLYLSAGDDVSEKTELGLQWYRRGEFELAHRFFGNTDSPNDPVHKKLMRCHATIMSNLYGKGIDVDWSRVIKAANDAKESSKDCGLSRRNLEVLHDRYTEILEFCQIILAVGKNEPRVVDFLSGLKTTTTDKQKKAAAVLMLLNYEAAINTPGVSNSFGKALALPEQTYRVWAYWRHDINYYSAPGDLKPVWEQASKWWFEDKESEMRTTAAGKQFASMGQFMYFTTAFAELHGGDNYTPILRNPADIQSGQNILNDRNAEAHSVVVFNEKKRKKFFELTKNWLEKSVEALPGNESWTSLTSIANPLPAISAEKVHWH